MAFIPFAATIGAALGGSATLGGIAVAGAAGLAANSVIQGQQQSKDAKKAAASAANQQASAIATLQQSQQQASTQAQDALTARRKVTASSTDIYTNPLGIGGQAQIAKKTLLGN